MDSFFTPHEFTRPMTCGKRMADFTFEQLQALIPELTEEERRSPFAHYYDQPKTPLQPEMLSALDAPLPAEQCYMPGDALPIMLQHNPAYPVNGYGVLENGVGYASAFVRQEGITDEMIRLYRDHFAHDPQWPNLFYKLWCPGFHYTHLDDGIMEDFGFGPQLQTMDWERLNMKAHLGLTHAEIAAMDPQCLAIMGLGGLSCDVFHPERRQHTFMVQYHRQTESGRELWIHYWVGVEICPDGTTKVCPAVDRETMAFQMKCMMSHAMAESCREVDLMRQFWQQQGTA